MPLHDLDEFLRLSEVLNLQLSVKSVGNENIAAILLLHERLPELEHQVLLRVLQYLDSAYGQHRRRLGPLAVLHPLRATALLARASEEPSLLDLLTCLLHDKLEDLTPESLGVDLHPGLEARFTSLIKSIDPRDEWLLMERLDWLTRHRHQTYFQYVARLLDQALNTPELVRIKLADRLDNTLDLHVEIEDPIRGVDFFGTMFQILYVDSFPGHRGRHIHPPSNPLSGAERLYQLFKNAVLMSMVRQRRVGKVDPTAQTLFSALAMASMKEAQRIVLHIFAYHQTDVRHQRALLTDVMQYAQRGGFARITPPGPMARLDGLFLTRFQDSDSEVRRRSLDQLYEDKDLMIEAALGFIIIFQSFMHDPAYIIHGISERGIQVAP